MVGCAARGKTAWALAAVLVASAGASGAEVLFDLHLSKPSMAADGSPLKHSVTGVRGQANFVDSPDGVAYWFDGLTDQLVVQSSPQIRAAFNTPFTVELSFLYHVPATQTRSYPCMAAGLDATGKLVWALRGFKYNDRCQFYTPPKTILLFGEAPKPMEWHHVAVCFTGKELVGYFDGVQSRQSVPWSGTSTPVYRIAIGQMGRSKWDRFSGLIKGVKISRGVLYDERTSEAARLAVSQRQRAASVEKFAPLMKPEDPAWEQRHPFMLFTKEEVPALRARLAKGRGPELLRHFRQECDEAIDPKSVRYVAPDTRFGLVEGRYWPVCNQALLPLATILLDDERYVKHGIKLLLTTARTTGYFGIAERDDASFAAAASTAMTLALGYDWAYRWMTPDERRTVRECLLELAAAEFEVSFEKSYRYFWTRNWNAMGMSALGHTSLAIQGETLAPTNHWLHTAKRLAEEYFNNAIGRDGGFMEGPAYFYYGVNQLVVFAAALAHSSEYDLFATTNLRRLPDYFCYCVAPWGGEHDPIGYCGPKIARDMHALAVLREHVPGKPIEWLWRASYGSDPYNWLDVQYYQLLWYRPQPEAAEPGLPLARHFRDRGMVKMRTGWDPDALAASFEAEWARPAAHDQADRGSFTINGYGGRWAVDAGGRDTPDSGSTRAHNLVTVDGKGQALFYQNSNTDAFITDYCHLPGMATTAAADLTNAYCYGRSWYLVRKDINDFRHVRRRFTMIRGHAQAPPYFIVTDDIDKDGLAHDYTWHLHTFGMSEAELTSSGELAVTKNWPAEESYLVHPKPAGAKPGPVPNAHKLGRAEFDIGVSHDGTYKLWGLGRAGDACPGGMDSWFISLGDREHVYWSGGYELYYKWLAVPGTFTLKKGKHKLVARMREPEARVVRFYLTDALDTAPVGWRPSTGPGRILIEASKPTRLTAPMTTGRERIISRPGGMRVVPLWPRQAQAQLGTLAPETTCTQWLYTLSVKAKNPRFAVLLYPHKPSMPELKLSRKGRVIELDWGGVVDRIHLRTDRAIDADGVISDADMVVLRGVANAGASPAASFVMANGSRLVVGGRPLVDLDGRHGTVLVHDGHVAVSGGRVGTFRVFAPEVKSVRAHDAAVTFSVVDGMVCPASGSVRPPTVLRWN